MYYKNTFGTSYSSSVSNYLIEYYKSRKAFFSKADVVGSGDEAETDYTFLYEGMSDIF